MRTFTRPSITPLEARVHAYSVGLASSAQRTRRPLQTWAFKRQGPCAGCQCFRSIWVYQLIPLIWMIGTSCGVPIVNLFPICISPRATGDTMWTTYFDVALLSSPLLAFLTIQHPKMYSKPSNLQYFLVSFVSLLFLRYAASPYFGTPQHTLPGVCTTLDQPNPIASLYPNNATGTLNGTVAVIPISLKLARQLIPPQYGILEHAYRALLPNFPRGMYPAIVQALHDHEVQAFGYKIDDFTVRLHVPDF